MPAKLKKYEDETISTKPGRRKQREAGAVGDIMDMVISVQDEVLDKRDIELDQLIFMTKNDGQARGILNTVKYPIKMARPKIKEAEGGSAEAEFIRTNLLGSPAEGGVSPPLRIIIARMALAVRDGYKVFEKVWKYQNGLYWLDKLAYRSTRDTKLTVDDHGHIDGAHQDTYFKDKRFDVRWKKNKIAYFVYNSEENPYMGESDFIPVFYHYDKKHKLYAIAHLAYQLNAVPIRIGKHPPGIDADALEAFRNALKALGTSVAMTFPENCEVESFESKRKLTEFLSLIQHHDSMMTRAFLAQFMNLGQEGRGGSFNLSQDQSNLFLMSLISFLEDIAEVFNSQVIPQLIDWNFGTKKYPKLVFSPFSDTIRSAIMSTFRSLLAARFPQVSPEFTLQLESAVADELGLEIDYKEVKKRMEEERRQLMEKEGEAEIEKKKAPGAKEETNEDLGKE